MQQKVPPPGPRAAALWLAAPSAPSDNRQSPHGLIWARQQPKVGLHRLPKVGDERPQLHVMWVIFVDISTTLEGLVLRDDGSLRCLLSIRS